MSFDFEEFKKRVRAAAPAPHDETPEYKKFSHWFSIVSFGLSVTLAYVLSIFFGQLDDLPVLSNVLDNSLFSGRMEFLLRYHPKSYGPYVATIAAGLVLIPVLFIANIVGYWKYVVKSGKMNQINRYTILPIGFACIVFGCLNWIVFFDVPSGYDPRYPGMARILFWPNFPALAAVMIVSIYLIAFSGIVGLVKFFIQFGDSNG